MRRSGTVVYHLFTDDGAPDHRGDTRCADCGLPKANRSHVLPQRTDDERKHEARKVGER